MPYSDNIFGFFNCKSDSSDDYTCDGKGLLKFSSDVLSTFIPGTLAICLLFLIMIYLHSKCRQPIILESEEFRHQHIANNQV